VKYKLVVVAVTLSTLLIENDLALATNRFGDEQKKAIIHNLAKAIKNEYVLVEDGLKFSEQLLEKYQREDFTNEESKEKFVQRINKSLYEITNDKHVSLRPQTQSQNNPMTRKVVRQTDNASAEQAGPRRLVKIPGQSNRSLKKELGLPEGESISSKILSGNIGLMTVSDLMGSETEVHQSMEKMANTDGLIIDVRSCPGGSGAISNQISSYFIDEGEALMRYYTRGEDVNISRSRPLPDGAKRYQNKPLYIVTSGFTGSACEALSYILKYHDRAIIIGEKSAGAGHALTRELTSVGSGLVAFIPNSRPEHPKHKGGFEKVGVPTDIQAGAIIAVERAHQMILSQLLQKADNNQHLSQALIKNNEKLTKKLLAQSKESRITSELLGLYGDKFELIYELGQLKLKSVSGRKLPLQRVSDNLFSVMFMRGNQTVKINRNKEGKVVSISMSPRPGQTEWKELPKT